MAAPSLAAISAVAKPIPDVPPSTTILFPFKRWVRESDTSAVEEFTNEGKSGFMGLSWRDVGGKKYLCKSNGLSGLKTAEDAEKAIKTCETLAAK